MNYLKRFLLLAILIGHATALHLSVRNKHDGNQHRVQNQQGHSTTTDLSWYQSSISTTQGPGSSVVESGNHGSTSKITSHKRDHQLEGSTWRRSRKQHRLNGTATPPLIAMTKVRTNRVYNPLPYGGMDPLLEHPAQIEMMDTYRKFGLPFARRPSRKEQKRQPLRLPIPDSETNSKSAEYVGAKMFSSKVKEEDIESFRVLMEVVKSLILVPTPSAAKLDSTGT